MCKLNSLFIEDFEKLGKRLKLCYCDDFCSVVLNVCLLNLFIDLFVLANVALQVILSTFHLKEPWAKSLKQEKYYDRKRLLSIVSTSGGY